MLQMQLPIFFPGLNLINHLVGFGQVYYFYGTLPIFHHDEDDTESFRFITSQLVVSGNVKQIEIRTKKRGQALYTVFAFLGAREKSQTLSRD